MFRVGAAYIVAGWLVTQVVETIFPAFGFGDNAVRYVVIVLAIGLIPTLIFAWAFELTPEGLRRDHEVDRNRSITVQTGKKLDHIIMVVLAVALGFFAFDKFVLSERREASIAESARQQGRSEAMVESYGSASIAVLPFTNMSADATNEYFSDGITEEILNLLARITQLRVVSRSSAFAYKGKEVHIPDVAEKLKVAHVLEGSVRKSGNQVRITAQLIEGQSDTHLWSQTYDRTLDDIFAVQDEIAAAVAEAMKLALVDGPPEAAVTNAQAHDFFLQGMHFYNKRTEDDYEKAVEYFQKALAEDPEYVHAWGYLGATYTIQATAGWLPYHEGFSLARAASEKALEIDPDSNLVLGGWIAMIYDRDFELAADYYRRALRLWPNDASTLNNGAILASKIGRTDKAIDLLNRATKADPTTAIPYLNLAQIYLGLGDLDAAERATGKALELNPEVYSAHSTLAMVSLLRGNPEQALDLADAIKFEMLQQVVRSIGLYELGRTDESNKVVEALIEEHADRYAYYIAMVYAWRGDNDTAFHWLNAAIDEHQDLDAIHIEAFLQVLHTDPRWEQMLSRVGLADSQVAKIEFY